MAEAALSLVIQNSLIPLLNEEASLLKGIHKEVKGLKRELESIQCFLRNAETRAEADDGVNLWVKELNETAMKIENVIDEYTYDIGHTRATSVELEKEESHARRFKLKFVNFVRKITCLICELKPRHDIAIKIKELTQEVQDINRRGTTYRFERSMQHQYSSVVSHRTWYDPREEARHLEENEIIGVHKDRKELVARLEAIDPQHEVVAIVGMGGIGKTTIANQVFNDVKKKFGCHAWVDVSQTYSKVEVLRKLIKQLYTSRNESVSEAICQETDVYMLTKVLKDCLDGKSYIVTFDDVWDVNFWTNIKNALPTSNSQNENHRGRIIITTRNIEVADSCKRLSQFVHVHQMKELSFESSMELFCKKVFRLDKDDCPVELKDLCHQAVVKCDGLPLAIVVLGGLLATKNKSVGEWTKLVSRLGSELECNKDLASIKRILSLSYNDLPYYLKPCFLYFGIYPEDYLVEKDRLVRQWVAEGFVRPQKYKTIEIVAEEYLIELINRSMVQVSDVDYPETLRVHDHMRDFILSKTKDLRFCRALSTGDDSNNESSRRVSIFRGDANAMIELNNVRSVFVFGKEEITDHLWTKIAASFKILKVLDFEDASISRLPEDIGTMFHLRYLSLCGSKVKIIPNSVGNLKSLETLDLRGSQIDELPVEINKLIKLRHLLSGKALKLKKGFGCLRALQTCYIDVDGVDLVEDFGKLRELRDLAIGKLRSKDGAALCSCLQNWDHLESFTIVLKKEEDTPPIDLEYGELPPLSIRYLHFHGHLKSVPSWISKLESLVSISFGHSKLEDDPLHFLQNLPNLLQLYLSGEAYHGEKLEFKGGTFLKLKSLTLYGLRQLNTLVIQQGALPNIEQFTVGYCPQLKDILSPSFNESQNLKSIVFRDLPVPLLLSYDFHSIQHVPQVEFSFTNLCGKTDLSWMIKAQGYVAEAEKEEWASLTIPEFKSRVDQLDAKNPAIGEQN